MYLPHDSKQLSHARSLRKDMTPEERRLWYTFLRTYPIKFYKQRIIGPFIADFYCDTAKLVIELDGSQHYETDGITSDKNRTQYLQGLGLIVVRYSNADINQHFRSVCEDIDRNVQHRLASI